VNTAGSCRFAPQPEEEASREAPFGLSERFEALIASASNKHPLRLGILGGTFDPIHLGHLHIAEAACDQYRLAGVLFIPAGKPAWKLDRTMASASDRFAMVAAAIANNPRFDLSSVEFDRPGISYTIDTLRILKEAWAEKVELYFIVGADAQQDIHRWKGASEIAGLVTLLAAERPRTLASNAEALSSQGFDIRFVDALSLDISASQIRLRARAGRSLRYLVPEAVRAYIIKQGLYRDSTMTAEPFDGSEAP
jgi:nicotinate-nucleotide adenylyltransferase